MGTSKTEWTRCKSLVAPRVKAEVLCLVFGSISNTFETRSPQFRSPLFVNGMDRKVQGERNKREER
jgi:hypothetical protein